MKRTERALGEENVVTLETLEDLWTAEENAALLELVDEHGLNFGHIETEADARLGDRTASALRVHFKRAHPETFKELREANPCRTNQYTGAWTKKEDETLKRGRKKHGADREKIPETENKVLGDRTAAAIKHRYNKFLRK